MPYEAKNFDHLLGTEGFSDTMLKNHFTLYQGYVTNVNKTVDALSRLSGEGKIGTPEYAEIKRRFGWEFSGMRLHEYYFGNMAKGGVALDAESALNQKIAADFGSYGDWEKDFKAVGALRGIGWAVLYYDPIGARLFNIWINEHEMGHLAGGVPVLALDVFEHAYVLDYGIKRADYIEAFWRAVDWNAAVERFRRATQ
ncbi:MAG: superoxide dismutase [Patescibacteria group bacterium]